jgi:hypothetical protein
MPTHVQLAVQLLRDAAGFFRNVGEQNEPLKLQMEDNADVYERVAELLDVDPTGSIDIEQE